MVLITKTSHQTRQRGHALSLLIQFLLKPSTLGASLPASFLILFIFSRSSGSAATEPKLCVCVFSVYLLDCAAAQSGSPSHYICILSMVVTLIAPAPSKGRCINDICYECVCVYVCAAIIYSRLGTNRERLPILLAVIRPNGPEKILSPCSPRKVWSRDRFG